MSGAPTSNVCMEPPPFHRDELDQAIATEELVLHHQPTVNLADGTVSGRAGRWAERIWSIGFVRRST